MRFILALDTSTPNTLVSVGTAPPQGLMVLALSETPPSHGPALLPLMDKALGEVGTRPQDLFAVGVGIGPGSFTGVRIGLATAKALAYATGIPMVAVDWFELLAGQFDDRRVAVVLDARRDELFIARYDGARRVTSPHLVPRDRLVKEVPPDEGWTLVGPWVQENAEELRTMYGPEAIPPRELHLQTPHLLFTGVLSRIIAEKYSSLDVEPLYLREPDAVINLRRRLARRKETNG